MLEEVDATLKQLPEQKLLIEGHTDFGRAAGGEAALVARYGIDESRPTAKGVGDTNPASPNATAARWGAESPGRVC